MNLLIVLGMHRSGTSALTGVLNLLGFSAGKRMIASNKFNERGYFENARLNQILDDLLKSLNHGWFDERVLSAGWLESKQSAAAVEDIRGLFVKEFNFNRPCVIKDPRVCRLLPLLQSILTSMDVVPGYIFSLRSPLAVIRSLVRRDSMAVQRAALLYVAYILDAELYTREKPRIFINYDDLLRDWRSAAFQIRSELGQDILPIDLDDLRVQKDIDEFLSADLNNYLPDEVVPAGVAVELALEVYALLQRPLNEAALVSLDNLRARWMAYLDSLEPWLTEANKYNRLCAELPKTLINPSQEILEEASLHARSVIYWATGFDDYDEERSVVAQWGYGREMVSHFSLPALSNPLKSLRWDISDRPAFCLIERFWIEDIAGSVQWRWVPGTSLFAGDSSDMHVLGLNDAGHLQVMAAGFDPHALLCIPNKVLAEFKQGWRVCAVWNAITPARALNDIAPNIAANRVCMLKTEEALRVTAHEVDILGMRVTEQEKELTEFEHKNNKAREEIVRAESQMSLLKELLINDARNKGDLVFW